MVPKLTSLLSARNLLQLRPSKQIHDVISMASKSYASRSMRPLLVMHGALSCKDHWDDFCVDVLRHASPLRRIINFDLRNHGDSPRCEPHTYPCIAEDIRLSFVQHQLSKASILGHSMGGFGGMYFALKYPHLVDRLIVADVSPVSTNLATLQMDELLRFIMDIQIPTQMPIKEAQEHITKQLGNSQKSMRHVILDNFVQRPNGYGWRTDVPAIVNYLRHWINFPVIPGSKFTGPTLFIRGGESRYIPESDHRQILEFFPNAEVQKIEGAGHFLHLQKPKEFRRVCLEFLNRD